MLEKTRKLKYGDGKPAYLERLDVIAANKQRRIEKEQAIIEVCKNNPTLSIAEKAKKAGVSLGYLNAVKHKYGIKQTKYITNKALSAKKLAIREMYSKGIYTYQEVGEKFGITREYVRQVVTDIRKELVKANQLTINRKHRTVDSLYRKRDIVYNHLIDLFEIAKYQYNKDILSINEITIAYYNLYHAKEGLKDRIWVYAALRTCITDLRYVTKNKRIVKLDRYKYKLESTEKPDPINLLVKEKDLFTANDKTKKSLKALISLVKPRGITFSNELLYVFAIALKDYNKKALSINEVTIAYYNIFGKNNNAKISKRPQIGIKLYNMCNREKTPYIEVIHAISSNAIKYALTQYGKDSLDKLLNSLEGDL